MVNDSCSQIPQMKKMNKQYTARDVMRADHTMRFQNITGQPVNRILQVVDNDIL